MSPQQENAANDGGLAVGVVQMSAIFEDFDGTLEKAEALIADAAGRGARLVVLPEFFSYAYFADRRDISRKKLAEDVETGPTYRALREWATRFDTWIVGGVYEKAAPGLLYDSAAFVSPEGEVVGHYRKTHPGLVQSVEKMYFRGGSEFPVFDIDGWPVGCNICYDLWFPEAMRCAALNGAELVVMPFATWEEPLWPQMLQVRAFENAIYIAAANKVGREVASSKWLSQGRSCAITPGGEVMFESSDSDDEVQVVTMYREQVEQARALCPVYRDRRPEVYGPITSMRELPR